MKRLAYEQRLYIIIAASDYIYGTNYSFCHGFIGKDLTHMTQQKIIQAMGRIGRNKVQQDYTIRFRDDDIMMRLFTKMEHNLEAVNMSTLFNSRGNLRFPLTPSRRNLRFPLTPSLAILRGVPTQASPLAGFFAN